MTLPAATEVRLRCLEAAARINEQTASDDLVLQSAQRFVAWVVAEDCKTDEKYNQHDSREPRQPQETAADIAPECPETSSPVPDSVKPPLCKADIEVDLTRNVVKALDQEVTATPSQAELMAALHERFGQVVSRGHLHDAVYGLFTDDETPDEKIIDVHVCKLRPKLAPLRLAIVKYWGRGYSLLEAKPGGTNIEDTGIHESPSNRGVNAGGEAWQDGVPPDNRPTTPDDRADEQSNNDGAEPAGREGHMREGAGSPDEPGPDTPANPAPGAPIKHKKPRDYKPWAEQDGELIRQWNVGVSTKEIAERLQRTESAVYTRAHVLGLQRRSQCVDADGHTFTPRERAVLDALCGLQRRGEPVTQAQIAIVAGIGLNHVGSCIGRLETKGYIKRHGHGRARAYEVLKTSDGSEPPRIDVPEPQHKPGQPLRRFTDHPELDPESVQGLDAGHGAVVEGRTLFSTTVVDPADSPQLLISGQNSRKLGDRVVKGPWNGMPIYQLTLEERATCPRSCHLYNACYGNGMPRARRHKHGHELEKRLERELAALQDRHPDGFVVRLHVLGDFYSADYVKRWRFWLGHFAGLRVFGYTAWPRVSEIGKEIERISTKYWERFAIRFSSDTALPQGVTTIWRKPEAAVVPEGIVCPAQTGATACCGTCGLCWSPAANDKTIVFVGHGPTWKRGTAAETREETVAKNAPAKAPFPAERKAYRLPSERGEEREVFTEGKRRRCAGCNLIFTTYHTGDEYCSECRGGLCSACGQKPRANRDLCRDCDAKCRRVPGYGDGVPLPHAETLAAKKAREYAQRMNRKRA